MTKKIDLTGLRFGRLVVLREDGKDNQGNIMYLCKCDCGNEIRVRAYSLRNGDCKSCGCLRNELSSQRNKTHGHSQERLFNVWRNMIKRCFDPNHSAHEYYYDKGITVCDEWLNNYEAFRDFMLSHGYNEYAPFGECTLDRIDNNKGYSPENCRVVSMKVQALNKSNNHIITYKLKQTTVSEAAKDKKLTSHQVFNRLNKGWTMKKALETPLNTTSTYTANGETHTIKEWAEIMNTTDSVIRGRLKTHTMQEIYNDYIINSNKIEVNDFSVKYETADGKTMNRKEWSNFLGINEATLRKLLKSYTMQEIYDNWKTNGGKLSLIRRGALEANGIKLTQKEWCEKLSISPKAMRKYLKNYTMQEIYDDCVNHLGEIRKNANPPKLHEVNGEIHSQAEWAKILGISASSLGQKLKKYTMQEVYNMHKDHIK